MKKALFVATVVKTHIMEFHLPYLRLLKDMGWETAVAARNDYANPADCHIPYCDTYIDIPFERNPVHPGNLRAYRQLKNLRDTGGFDLVHCHTPVGGLLTRLAAEKARKQGARVFYTAHGFHFFTGAPLQNWLLYYPVERLLARKTDVLITITHEDYERAKGFPAGKVVRLPGVGVDLSRFTPPEHTPQEKERIDRLRASLGIPSGVPVLLSVGEVNRNKNHRAVIACLPELPNVWYVLCGSGPLLEEHRQLALRLGVGDRVVLAGYRTDVADFYRLADAFVFPSYREGLPVALMEAMAAGLPCVAALNRGTRELLPGSRLLFAPDNGQQLLQKLRLSLAGGNEKETEANRQRLKEYDLSHTLSMMKNLYEEAAGSQE